MNKINKEWYSLKNDLTFQFILYRYRVVTVNRFMVLFVSVLNDRVFKFGSTQMHT